MRFDRLNLMRDFFCLVIPTLALLGGSSATALSADFDACLAAIDKYMPDAVATRPDGGFFLSLTLPEGTSTTAVRQAATKRQLNLADGLDGLAVVPVAFVVAVFNGAFSLPFERVCRWALADAPQRA